MITELIKSNARLYLEYALIALVLAIGGLAVTLKVQAMRQEVTLATQASTIERLDSDLTLEKARVSLVEGVAQAQGVALGKLADQRKIDGDIMNELLDTYQGLQRQDEKLRSQLDSLRDDDNAKEYLAAPVPDSVACLWDDSCPEATTASGNSGQKGNGATYPSPGSAASLLLAPETKAAQ